MVLDSAVESPHLWRGPHRGANDCASTGILASGATRAYSKRVPVCPESKWKDRFGQTSPAKQAVLNFPDRMVCASSVSSVLFISDMYVPGV